VNVAEHFRALDINDVESAVSLLTMGLYPDIFKDRKYVAQFIDEDYVDWYLENFLPEDEEIPIYDKWPTRWTRPSNPNAGNTAKRSPS
jgi:hypothetical protein